MPASITTPPVALINMDALATGFAGCHPLAITYPSNAEWIIYGAYEPLCHIYAQPKCISYPLFVIIKMNIHQIWTGGQRNVEFGMRVLQLLTRWSESITNFKEFYASLFNATLTFRESSFGYLVYDITEMCLSVVPIDPTQPNGPYTVIEKHVERKLVFKVTVDSNQKFENQLRTFVTLRNFWGIRPDAPQGSSTNLLIRSRKMPPTIALTSLLLGAWVHDTVNLVSIPHSKDPEALYAFKTNQRTYRFYQELDSLLNMPFHPNILQPPSYLVTKNTLYSTYSPSDPASLYFSEPTEPIIGFLTPFHAGGKLRDVIRAKASAGMLTKNDQSKWARQLISALLHVFEHENGANKHRCGTHTCLKMDNIVVGSPEEGSNLVLIDFEKGGNWWYYSPPERLHYAHQTSREPHMHGASILGRQNSEHVYIGPEKCIYEELFWEHISNRGCEKAMVYSLGCCLWCILQGNGCIRDARRQYPALWPSADECPWDPVKLETYETPQTVRCIVTDTFQNNHRSRPTLRELLDVFESWEKCLNGIEVELVGEGKSNAEPTEEMMLEGGMILEGGTKLGLLGSEITTCV